MSEKLKRLANVALGIICFVAVCVVIPAVFVVGAVKLSSVIWPLLELLSIVVFAVALLVLFPLSFLEACRPFAATYLLISSYVLGATLWVDALLVTKVLWGTAGVVVGLVLAGIGIVPIGILASLFNAAWPQFWDLLLLAAVTYAFRAYAFRVAVKTDLAEETKSPTPRAAV